MGADGTVVRIALTLTQLGSFKVIGSECYREA